MSSILIARFDTVPDATSAAHALVADGCTEESVNIFPAEQPREDVNLKGWWSVRVEHTAMAAVAAAGTAGATLAAGAMSLYSLSAVYSVMAVAMGALSGFLTGIYAVHKRQAESDTARTSLQGAFVAVIAEPGQEVRSAETLRDAGGRRVGATSQGPRPIPKP